MKQTLTIILLAIFATAAAAQTTVRAYDYTKGHPQGIVYALPRTAIDITVTVRRTECFPGPFYQYAERYLALTDVITAHYAKWEITGVTIASHPEADPSRLFEVAPDKRGTTNLITLTPQGIIRGVNIDRTDSPRKHEAPTPGEPSGNKPHKRTSGFDMSVLNEETLTATSTPKMAEFAAKQIYRIRESRAAILAGETENFPDGKALKAILKQYDEDEAALIALFAGRRQTITEQRTYTVTPASDIKRHLIARLSEVEGLVAPEDVIGTPVYVDIQGFYPPAPVSPDNKRKKAEPAGFAYIVPASAAVTVSTPDRTLAETTLTVPQFGYIARLSTLISDRPGISILFDPRTGAIRRIAQ